MQKIIIMFLSICCFGGCKNFQNKNSHKQIKYYGFDDDSIAIQKIISLNQSHVINKKEISNLPDSIPHIQLSIAAGWAGEFSPQFNLVNESLRNNKNELLKNLGKDDTLLNILSIFALEKHGVVDTRIHNEKLKLIKMHAVLSYRNTCTGFGLYYFNELFDTTANGQLLDLLNIYLY